MFLYHSGPVIAYVLTCGLFEDIGMCEVFKVDLIGLTNQNKILSERIESQIPDLANKFIEFDVLPEMFTTTWVLILFSHVIPMA